jgi:hypothetical protein
MPSKVKLQMPDRKATAIQIVSPEKTHVALK